MPFVPKRGRQPRRIEIGASILSENPCVIGQPFYPRACRLSAVTEISCAILELRES